MNKGPRISAKAIIIQDEKILLIKKSDAKGEYFIFPGGGQDRGENLHQAIVREVKEETGFAVEPLDLIFVRDYIGANHEFAADSSHIHQVELYFEAKLASDGHTQAHLLDSGQIGIEWVPLSQIGECRVFPLELREFIRETKSPRIYLGDIN